MTVATTLSLTAVIQEKNISWLQRTWLTAISLLRYRASRAGAELSSRVSHTIARILTERALAQEMLGVAAIATYAAGCQSTIRFSQVELDARTAGAWIAVFVISLGASAPAQAQTTIYYPNNVSINLPVTASIRGACGFVPGGNLAESQDVGELNDPFNFDFPFVLQCTVASRIAIVSSNGGLLAAGTPAPGYTTLAPYVVSLHMQGATITADGTCPSTNLRVTSQASCTIRGSASTADGLHLQGPSFNVPGSYVRISSPGYTGSDILIASDTYVDTLTVTVSPAT